jgi:hypothetical protein
LIPLLAKFKEGENWNEKKLKFNPTLLRVLLIFVAENDHKYRATGRMWGKLELYSDAESTEEFDRV